jgi:hypothetical protein
MDPVLPTVIIARVRPGLERSVFLLNEVGGSKTAMRQAGKVPFVRPKIKRKVPPGSFRQHAQIIE